MNLMEEQFMDEQDEDSVPCNVDDLYYDVPTAPENFNNNDSDEAVHDFETVSSISRMSSVTDVVLLSDPELGVGRILALAPPQPDEATIDRPLQTPQRLCTKIRPTHHGLNGHRHEIEPPVQSIITMGPVQDDPTFDTITLGDGVLKVRRHQGQRRGNASDKSTDDGDSSDPSCDDGLKEISIPSHFPWKWIFLLFAFSFLVGASAAYIVPWWFDKSTNNPSSPDDIRPDLPEKQTMDKAEDSRDKDGTFSPTHTPSVTQNVSEPPTKFPNTTSPFPSVITTAHPTMSPSTALTTQPSVPPSFVVSVSLTTLQEGIDSILAETGLSNVALIRLPSSPQNLAYQFILATTELNVHSPWQIRQRYIMAVFYFATSGDGWEKRHGWMVESDECLWYSQDSSPCNARGEFVRLILPSNNLIGEIPSELGFLSSLTEIELRGNDLEGEIPASLGRLENLEIIDLSWTDVDGSIPSSLGEAVFLKRINLVNTHMNGPIPAKLGNLINLEELLVVKTDLTGFMPASVCALRELSLHEVWADCDALDCPCCNYCCYRGQIEFCQTV